MQIYMGYDSREDIAFQAARRSFIKRASGPFSMIPLRLNHLPMLTRPIEQRGDQLWDPISNAPMSTEFAISRFCVPFLQEGGWALFCDCDIICWEDISHLFALADDKYAIMVVKQKQEGGENTKMDGQIQTFYARKNWSSVVLWNCSHPSNQRLTEERLNNWPGRYLHGFNWLDDEEIGELPQKWNWLVNVTPGEPEKEGIWHWTLGGPWFENWEWHKHDDAWLEEAGIVCESLT